MFSQLQKMNGNVENVLVSVDLIVFMCVFVFSENPVMCGKMAILILRFSLLSDSILSSSDLSRR